MKRIFGICLIFLLLATPILSLAQEGTEEPAPEETQQPTVEATTEPTDEVEATDEPTPEPEQETEEAEPEPTAQQEPTPTPQAEQTTYIVQPGDNLYRIALRFGTTTSALAAANNITNSARIFVGQQLIIPGTTGDAEAPPAQPAPTSMPPTTAPQPTTAPAQTGGTTYIVRPGDSLYSIAIRNGTTVAELIAVNNLANPNVIFTGQTLIIPGEDTPPPSAADAALDETSQPAMELPETPGFDYGIEVYFGNQDAAALVNLVEQLGMNWVKVRVDWRQLEPEQGQINFEQLDEIVSLLENANLDILFTVTNSPAWARTTPDENGPPDDFANFETFIRALADHYAGRIAAYQVWDEPNLRRNWNCDLRMCDADYVEMLRLAYNAIKQVDANAVVVTAGLAPTRFNDRVNAIDDRLYLATLYDQGIAEISDGIGAHPGGWANPPDARCCEQPSGVESHYESDSFYFLENLTSYRGIMEQYGDDSTPIWITKFGWGTSEDTDPPGQINEFVTYTSLGEQALYVPRAFELGNELGYIGPMFLNNLNGCQGASGRSEVCYTSLIAPDGAPRPVFDTVRDIEKSVQTTDEDSDAVPIPTEATEEES